MTNQDVTLQRNIHSMGLHLNISPDNFARFKKLRR